MPSNGLCLNMIKEAEVPMTGDTLHQASKADCKVVQMTQTLAGTHMGPPGQDGESGRLLDPAGGTNDGDDQSSHPSGGDSQMKIVNLQISSGT